MTVLEWLVAPDHYCYVDRELPDFSVQSNPGVMEEVEVKVEGTVQMPCYMCGIVYACLVCVCGSRTEHIQICEFFGGFFLHILFSYQGGEFGKLSSFSWNCSLSSFLPLVFTYKKHLMCLTLRKKNALDMCSHSVFICNINTHQSFVYWLIPVLYTGINLQKTWTCCSFMSWLMHKLCVAWYSYVHLCFHPMPSWA